MVGARRLPDDIFGVAAHATAARRRPGARLRPPVHTSTRRILARLSAQVSDTAEGPYTFMVSA